MQHWKLSDSSYMYLSKARSRVGGCYFLENTSDFENPLEHQSNVVNSPFYVEASILKSFIGAASEYEVATACANSRKQIAHRITLMELNHHQQ